MKYCVISDLHNHASTVFSKTNPDGVNSRLRIILNETERAARALVDAGGMTMVIAGDVFHTRGVMDPEVLNPTRESFQRIVDMGVLVRMIPGNHDLKTRDTVELSSAIQNLATDFSHGGSVRIHNETFVSAMDKMAFVPWRYTTAELLDNLKFIASKSEPEDLDVFIHAGIDGVLPNAPGSGLTDTMLADFGFRHVFAGHYHNHKIMQRGVVSIGATTHHNWSDIDTRAGFLLVEDTTGDVEFFASSAPRFVDISMLDEEMMEIECAGNYVRYRGSSMSQDDINEFRQTLIEWDALGVSIEVPRISSVTRSARPGKGLTLKQSINSFVDELTLPVTVEKIRLIERCHEVLDQSQAVIDEA